MDKNKFYVVTEKDISDLKYDEIYDKLDQKSQLYLNSEPNDIRLRVLHSFQDCESPIERILSWEMDRFGLCNFGYFNTSIYQVDIFHQLPIYLKQKKTYRVDFLIGVYYINKNKTYKIKDFVIECDGHDFHEKTKEQVAYNNQKTRDLEIEGHKVIHFSGSEIYNNPTECVKQIIAIILTECK